MISSRSIACAFILNLYHYSFSIADVAYPPSVCVTGDVQELYDNQRDPRLVMGNYQEFNSNATYDEDLVDTSVPIYRHINFASETNTVKDVYLYRVSQVGDEGGWVIAPELPLDSTSTVSVYLTCFQSSLFDCQYTKWFWAYNKYEYAIPTLKVIGGECSC